ncbi:5-hydroxytryptamine receptor 3A-like [Conger conger]|uniref:5-hydroxytryptamine receptor 3A-like n=1 Tax=Conger conger TaxID=82655 RepID=UPI002A5B0F12|nr:5-hydroxytryptamine receptor 3A-like [Conger conger]
MAREVSALEVCSYQSILAHLNLTRGNEVFTSARPVKDWTHPTVVHLDVFLYAILAVIEKSQTFIPFIWLSMTWNNELISWDPEQFCGICQVAIPQDMLWHPDLIILEHTEDYSKIFKMPFIQITHNGSVSIEDGFRVTSTCKMDVYKFPFDIQSCVLSFSSVLYADSEIQLLPVSNNYWLTRGTQQYLQTQGEWDFVNISVTEGEIKMRNVTWDSLNYTITIKRRPLLVVMHFLMPILFFLLMDLSTFLISDVGGEKLGFKVTVLLAISVLLLMLNETLPSTAGRTPLIATYCIVTFSLLLASLLEAIVVKHLIERDDAARAPAEGGLCCQQEAERVNTCVCREDVAVAGEPGRGGEGPSDSQLLRLAVQELCALRRGGLTRDLGCGDTAAPPRFWRTVARRINTVFFCLYLLTSCSFLLYLCLEWTA